MRGDFKLQLIYPLPTPSLQRKSASSITIVDTHPIHVYTNPEWIDPTKSDLIHSHVYTHPRRPKADPTNEFLQVGQPPHYLRINEFMQWEELTPDELNPVYPSLVDHLFLRALG